jgi:hypothetical protein
LIAYGRIRVSRLQDKFATNGKSMVSEYELKTVRTIGSPPYNYTPKNENIPVHRIYRGIDIKIKKC